MRDNARVCKIKDDKVQVIPFITDACINCNAVGCPKIEKAFWVSNRKKFDLQIGTVVKIKASSFAQALQATFSLVFPILSSCGGYFLIGFICTRFFGVVQVTESIRILGVLTSFLVASAIVYLLSTTVFIRKKSYICEIISNPTNVGERGC